MPLESRTALIGRVLTLERMTSKEATFAATQKTVTEELAENKIRYLLTQFSVTKLTNIQELVHNPPYYLYRLMDGIVP